MTYVSTESFSQEEKPTEPYPAPLFHTDRQEWRSVCSFCQKSMTSNRENGLPELITEEKASVAGTIDPKDSYLNHGVSSNTLFGWAIVFGGRPVSFQANRDAGVPDWRVL